MLIAGDKLRQQAIERTEKEINDPDSVWGRHLLSDISEVHTRNLENAKELARLRLDKLKSLGEGHIE